MTTLQQKSKDARLTVLDMVYKAQSSHIGSNFSCIDFLTVLFDKIDLSKDQVILSAGWKAAAFYYFLADKGFISKEDLMTYNQEGSKLIGLTEPGVPGVLFAGGSMQMGVPAAVGFALAKKMKDEEGIVYCIMSDGEIAGGMIYESLLIAKHHELNNLVLLVDFNKLQAMGGVKDILNIGFVEPTYEINGHDHWSIECMLRDVQKRDLPTMVFCHTIKGKGVSFMENNNLYHYKNLSDEEYEKAKTELQNG